MLSLKNIEKEYNGRKILNGVNLEFPAQGLFFIVGASGAGKTSLSNSPAPFYLIYITNFH